MTYREFGEHIGLSEATISRAMNMRKGQMKSNLANKLAKGGFLTAYEWKYTPAAQRRRLWLRWVKELDDSLLEGAELCSQ